MPAKKPKTILVYYGDFEESDQPDWRRWAGERVYASREAVRLPAGMDAPAPDSWELVSDAAVEYRGGRAYLPEHELEPTAQAAGRSKCYYSTLYGHDGRDLHGPDGNIFVLPHYLGPEVFIGDVFGSMIKHRPWLNPE